MKKHPFDDLTIGVSVSRRDFAKYASLAFLTGVTVVVSGCGAASSTTTTGAVNGTISGNHGHIAQITAAQLAAGGTLTLNITGAADHTHGATLSANNMATLKAGGTSVTVVSTTGYTAALGNHTHNITFG